MKMESLSKIKLARKSIPTIMGISMGMDRKVSVPISRGRDENGDEDEGLKNGGTGSGFLSLPCIFGVFSDASTTGILGRTCSKRLIGRRSGPRFSRQACSHRERGFRTKASYSISRTSVEDIDSIAP